MYSCSSTAQEAGTGASHAIPVPTAEVNPHAAGIPSPSASSSCNQSDLGTVPSPSALSADQKFSPVSPRLLKSTQLTVKNDVTNPNGPRTFLGSGTLLHWMVSSVLRAIFSVLFGSIMCLFLHPSVTGRMLLVHLVVN